jgi:hypothetical protein
VILELAAIIAGLATAVVAVTGGLTAMLAFTLRALEQGSGAHRRSTVGETRPQASGSPEARIGPVGMVRARCRDESGGHAEVNRAGSRPGLESGAGMTAHDAARTWWLRSRRRPVDDAYTAWFGAHSRCTQALRAWSTAAPATRAAAYRAYLAELELEEEAASELERFHPQAATA